MKKWSHFENEKGEKFDKVWLKSSLFQEKSDLTYIVIKIKDGIIKVSDVNSEKKYSNKIRNAFVYILKNFNSDNKAIFINDYGEFCKLFKKHSTVLKF